jgi:4-hydroxy-tetrahydrodipicolinate reductase
MSKLKIAIVGYGQMGNRIEALANESGNFIVTDIFDTNNPITGGDYQVAIDFTKPDSAFENVEKLAGLGKNIVLGTTGWYSDEEKMKNIIDDNGVGLVWGSNFSVGVQMFFRIIRATAKLVDKMDGYDVFAHEIHHKRKKDSPSGTAESIGKILLEELSGKSSLGTGRMDEPISPDKLHFSSSRGGEIFGRHTVYLDSLADTIELQHNAKSRDGFALGSLKAAEWIFDKKGFYSFDEVMDDIFK